jgi:hydroxyacylglutathione hydrolase
MVEKLACSVRGPDGLPEVSPNDLSANLSKVSIIDVRRPDEFVGDLGHIKGARLVTLESDFERELPKLSKDVAYVFVCRSGGRSGRATAMALQAGLQNVYNMTGGMLSWNASGLPIEK